MLKRIWIIFTRDLRINVREFMTIYMIVIPLILAVGINFLSPGVNDTSVNLALIKDENIEQAAYFDDFAHVELFSDEARVENRVKARDDVVGILPKDNGYYIMTQGNESESVIEYAKLLNVLYESDVQLEDARSEIIEFGRTVPPLKKMLVNVLLLLISMLAGMLIAINILEEKVDNTVSAINVAPISRKAWVFGKSIIGLALPLIGSYALVLITGFNYINFGQLTLLILASTIISIVVGFIQGLASDDVMTAVAGIKMLMLPMIGSVVGAEFIGAKWQWTIWWSPFYWLYKGYNDVLADIGRWPQIILYSGIVIVLNVLVYLYLAPKIRKGLEH